MRIAYIIADKYIPVFGSKGASIHVQEMVSAFAALGHEVVLIAVKRGEPGFSLAAEIIEAGAEGILNAESIMLDGDEKRRAKELQSIKISDMIRDKIIALYQQKPFDFIYERYSLFSSAGIEASRHLGIPAMIEVNAPLVQEQQRFRRLYHQRRAEDIERQVFTRANGLLAVSDEVKNYCLSRGAKPSHVHILANGVDIRRFHPKPHVFGAKPDNGHFTIGFVGSLKPWHGLEFLLDAFRELAAESNDFQLLIIGDGPLRDWIEGYASGAGFTRQMTLTGWVSHRELPELMRTVQVAVAPYPPSENFYFSPLKLYEYMAMGIPVVASRLGQVCDVVEDGVTGFLTTPGNVRELVDRIRRLYADKSLRQTMSVAAVKAIQGRSWTGNAKRVVEIAAPLLQAA